ncbi:MAG: Spore protein YkvP [Syntrophomonadaceae bacterium]|nr:Spore protein YkvP [Bacillota bacterium]
MKIILVAMLYGYGIEERGYSYEYYNWYQPLKEMYGDVQMFDFMTLLKQKGKQSMNQMLLSLVKECRPDLVMFSLYTDQFIPEVVDELREYTKTLCFFHDDGWRVEFSRFWARRFDWFTTPDSHRVQEYRHSGYNNAVYFPYACNPAIYKKLELPQKYDVSFIGGAHPYRKWFIKKLKKAGINVYAAGSGWPARHLTQDEMVRVINQSKINLNLSNSKSWDLRYLLSLISSPKGLYIWLRSPKNVEQMKARPFEINGCGGFQLSYYVDGLEHCYEIGQEIVVYLDVDDLIRKVKYYLAHDDEREAIANRGYQRTLAEHTYSQRFQSVFARMGFSQ